jgi:DNA repair exonuclease SbcCD nuclease subunit
MTRFIHSADWQIGMTRYFLDEDAQARYSTSRLDAIRKIGELADQHQCEFLVVAGDVFESNYLDRRVVLRALDAMGSIQIPVVLLPGNHDPLNPGSVYNSPVFRDRCPKNVHVIRSSDPLEIVAGVQIIGAPWMSKRPLSDLVGRAIESLPMDDTLVRVVVGHGIVDSIMSPNAEDPTTIIASQVESALDSGLVQYVALGDRHSYTPLGDSGRFNYSGAIEPTDFDEDCPGQALLVEVTRDTCRVEVAKLASWAFLRHEHQLSDPESVDELDAWLDRLENKERSIVQLSLTGSISVSTKARLDSALESARDIFAAVVIWERRSEIAIIPENTDFSELGLTGFAADALEDLMSLAAAGGDEGKKAIDALSLLYRLAGVEQ